MRRKMISVESDYRKILRRELEVRCQQSPRYSLRRFAGELRLSPSRLSEILNGKQGLSRESARGVAQNLGYTPGDTEMFCDLVECQHARGRLKRELARIRLEKHRM